MLRKILLSIAIIVIVNYGSHSQSNTDSTENRIKYIFYFIGDGMGLAQSHAAELYLASLDDSNNFPYLNMDHLPYQTFYTTHAENAFITGSAASATAMASGIKTSIGTIGLNGDHSKPLSTIAYKAKSKGMKVGVITSVSIDHATPAGFYAHQESREMYYQIGIDLLRSNFDFFGGGGFIEPLGPQNDKTNLYDLATERNYKLIYSKADFLKLKPTDGKILAFNRANEGLTDLPYYLEQTHSDITLKEYLNKSIELLYNEKGFFIMLEGGKIDWACHENDAASSIHEVIAFDEAIGLAMEFYNEHPDETIIIVSADHETGGMSLGNSAIPYELNLSLIDYQKKSMDMMINEYTDFNNPGFKEALQYLEKNLGFNGTEEELTLSEFELKRLKKAYKFSIHSEENQNNSDLFVFYGDYHPFISTGIKIFNEKTGIAFTTEGHTGIPVPLRFIGIDPKAFSRLTDNTDISVQIEKLLELDH